MAKIVNEQRFLEGCKDGGRVNLQWRERVRLVDGTNEKLPHATYFLLYFTDDKENPEYWLELSAEEAFDVLATYLFAIREYNDEQTMFDVIDNVIEEILFAATE